MGPPLQKINYLYDRSLVLREYGPFCHPEPQAKGLLIALKARFFAIFGGSE
jgi:hypothetical protein